MPAGRRVRSCLRTATFLVPDHENASDMPLRDLTRVEGRDQVDSELVRPSTMNGVRDSEREVVRARDQERLDDILHEAVVLDGATALDLQQRAVAVIGGVDRVRVDAISGFPFSP